MVRQFSSISSSLIQTEIDLIKFSCLTALREVLDQRGVLNQLKARIRAEVFNALDEQVCF
jgi:hypothetical protein